MTHWQYFSGADRVTSLGWSRISKFYQKKIYRLTMTNLTKCAHRIDLEMTLRTNMTKTRHLNSNMAQMNIDKTPMEKFAPFRSNHGRPTDQGVSRVCARQRTKTHTHYREYHIRFKISTKYNLITCRYVTVGNTGYQYNADKHSFLLCVTLYLRSQHVVL